MSTVTLYEDTYKKLDALSDRHDMTITEIIDDLVENYLDDYRKEMLNESD